MSAGDNVTLTPQWKWFLSRMKRGEIKAMVLPGDSVNHVIIRMDDFDDLCAKAGVDSNVMRTPSPIVEL